MVLGPDALVSLALHWRESSAEEQTHPHPIAEGGGAAEEGRGPTLLGARAHRSRAGRSGRICICAATSSAPHIRAELAEPAGNRFSGWFSAALVLWTSASKSAVAVGSREKG